MRTRSLSFHGHYRCRHSGACCTAGWPIPIEADRLAHVRAAMASGVLRVARDAAIPTPAFVDAGDGTGDAPALVGVAHDACVFFDADQGRQCAIQRALGHEALPLACRQFPRVSVHDPRGVSITLSHFCPTAAALLAGEPPVVIVENASAFPATGEYVGLDARNSLPPRLRPDMLMDWETWWEWERLSVDLLANSPLSPTAALAQLSLAVTEFRDWQPGEEMTPGVFFSWHNGTCSGFDSLISKQPLQVVCLNEKIHQESFREVLEAVPEELRGSIPRPVPGMQSSPSVVKRFLAAHAFANWTAHLGEGLRTWLRSLEAAHALLVCGYDVRSADLVLRHLADPTKLAEIWSRVEERPRSRGQVIPRP